MDYTVDNETIIIKNLSPRQLIEIMNKVNEVYNEELSNEIYD